MLNIHDQLSLNQNFMGIMLSTDANSSYMNTKLNIYSCHCHSLYPYFKCQSGIKDEVAKRDFKAKTKGKPERTKAGQAMTPNQNLLGRPPRQEHPAAPNPPGPPEDKAPRRMYSPPLLSSSGASKLVRSGSSPYQKTQSSLGECLREWRCWCCCCAWCCVVGTGS